MTDNLGRSNCFGRLGQCAQQLGHIVDREPSRDRKRQIVPLKPNGVLRRYQNKRICSDPAPLPSPVRSSSRAAVPDSRFRRWPCSGAPTHGSVGCPPPCRVHPGPIEDLTCVDIAQACQPGLIHEQGFDRCPTAAHDLSEISRLWLTIPQGVLPQAIQTGCIQRDPS